MDNNIAVSLRHITKAFGSKVVANKDVSMDIHEGEILALLGENGSGKTTLMNMLSGIYRQDSGQIYVNGSEVHITSPKDAYDLGIGMIHQHFKLVDVFTATENVALGMDKKTTGSYKDLTRVAWLNPEMWAELFLENSDNLSRELGGLIEQLNKYKEAIDSGDRETLVKLLAEGRRMKEEADGR